MKRLDTERGTGSGSVLDLTIVSANIDKGVRQFTVDSQRKMKVFAMIKNKNKIVEQMFTDHFTINLKLKIPVEIFAKGKKRKIINMKNEERWLLYPETTDRYASNIVRAVEDTEDPDELEKN